VAVQILTRPTYHDSLHRGQFSVGVVTLKSFLGSCARYQRCLKLVPHTGRPLYHAVLSASSAGYPSLHSFPLCICISFQLTGIKRADQICPTDSPCSEQKHDLCTPSARVSLYYLSDSVGGPKYTPVHCIQQMPNAH